MRIYPYFPGFFMNRFILSFLTLFLLTACTTVLDRSIQEFRVETPGVEGATCYLLRPGFTQKIFPPQTIKITKANDDMTVRCLAMGNREKTIVVESRISKNAMLNMYNGFLPGILYDYDTGSLFRYPDVVKVDFSGTLVKPMPLPDYQKFLMENPMIADMEEFRPGQPALQRDRYESVPTLQPRTTGFGMEGETGFGLEVEGNGAVEESNTSTGSTPSASTISPADALTRQMNPGVFGGGSSSSNGSTGGSIPIPIYPVQ